MNNSTVLLFGGVSETKESVLEIEEYIISVDDWVILNVFLPIPLIGSAAIEITGYSLVMIFGGSGPNGPTSDVLCFIRPTL